MSVRHGWDIEFWAARRANAGVHRDSVPLLVSDHETRNIKYFLFAYWATGLKRLPRNLDGRRLRIGNMTRLCLSSP